MTASFIHAWGMRGIFPFPLTASREFEMFVNSSGIRYSILSLPSSLSPTFDQSAAFAQRFVFSTVWTRRQGYTISSKNLLYMKERAIISQAHTAI